MHKFTKIGVASLALIAAASAHADQYSQGFHSSNGYQPGFQQGMQQGYQQGYQQGNMQGYSTGSGTQDYYNQQFPTDPVQGTGNQYNVYGGTYGHPADHPIDHPVEGQRFDQGRSQQSFDQRGQQMDRQGDRRSLLSDAGGMATDNSTDAAYKVRRALQSDTSLSIAARNIQVSLNSDNEILLTGKVKDEAEKRKVENIAKKASGLQDVINKLKITNS